MRFSITLAALLVFFCAALLPAQSKDNGEASAVCLALGSPAAEVQSGASDGLTASGERAMPASILILVWLSSVTTIGFSQAVLRRVSARKQFEGRFVLARPREASRRRAVVLGAGPTAQSIVRGLRGQKETRYEIIGLLDDRHRELDARVCGVKALGPIKELSRLLAERAVDEVIVAIPDVSAEQVRPYIIESRKQRLPVKVAPRLNDIAKNGGRFRLEDFSVEDFLLSRAPLNGDSNLSCRHLSGKRVLVTGAGGSIGSELCRQIAACQPESLVLLGHGENSVFGIHNELAMDFPGIADRLHWVIASVADEHRLSQVFERFRPQVVFHAAAHKHVPVMEANLHEAVQNNVLGTGHVAEACGSFGVERMILISTDKAADPISVMGATKLLAEEVVRHMAVKWPRTIYATVRFGNVLGSRGSVVPIFREQIKRGGPVTITHPEMTRYFMTIPEAVHLVLQAGTSGESGKLYLLDMGTPVKILDLAQDMIRLCGYEPHADIPIRFSGVRAGEKIHELLISGDCRLEETNWPGISMVNRPKNFAPNEIPELLERLKHLTQDGDREELRSLLTEMAPGFASASLPPSPTFISGEK